jgi:serine protease Do
VSEFGPRPGPRWWILGAVFALGGLLGFLLLPQVPRPAPGSAESPGLQSPAGGTPGPTRQDTTRALTEETTRSRETALVRAARKAGPAVVSINVIQARYVEVRPFLGLDPFEAFFRGFIPGRIYREEIPGLGSGVIIDPEGIILTNHHVVEDAEEIKVTLADGRTFDGRLLGSDPTYDLAVVKIDGENLPYAVPGDSDDLMVGEWVVAIGNPFGFLLNDTQPTVTVGVVSATHRDIRPSEGLKAIYKDMIQTDAAINPGNSGGPLVNSLGEVVGINTFIFTKGGGSVGIGFAIPINTALRVAQEILQYGRVRKPWIGLTVYPITPYVAAYFQIRDRRGLLVWSLDKDGPAYKAGIRVGDIIRGINGRRFSSAQQASAEAKRLIFGARIGDKVTMTLERDGKLFDVEVVLEEEPRGD